ncbi:mitochondrial cysteine synthase [Andalucia godoyi]|uniref:Mitochondrial cysteine synthase n=1 Tax=Andalucia godoyi TaxID=505711 RepID=A0A8K0AFR4_ANDGO|nr:mitochondrial cysteine synthase [Andalucia godoyi]|eukprot:ANDGO_01180.mRNA.1 mitochondrial cysteine synthase
MIINNVFEAVGNTPLWRIRCLSRVTGCHILLKAEFYNPGGSIKDRAARSMILDAEARGILDPAQPEKYGITDETGGNTGIALALLCRQRGYKCVLTVNEGTEEHKLKLMERLGAKVVTCPADVSFDDPEYYVNKPRSIAAENPGFYFTQQAENWANPMAHIVTTGPEIWKELDGQIGGFVCSSGTGGTIAGMSTFLKSKNPGIRAFLVDPPGSGNREFFEHRNFKVLPGSTHAAGAGSTYLTGNFAKACRDNLIDGSFPCSNAEMAQMNQLLAEQEGLFLGPSSGMNLVGAVKLARLLGPGKTIVTVACDRGENYASTLCDPAEEKRKGIFFRNVSPLLEWVN